MDYLNFSDNWNGKLSNEIFTSVRLRDDSRFIIGKVLAVIIVNKEKKHVFEYGPHEIIMIKHLLLPDFTEFIALIDAGCPLKEFIKLIKTTYNDTTINWETQQLSVLLLKKKRRNERQQELF